MVVKEGRITEGSLDNLPHVYILCRADLNYSRLSVPVARSLFISSDACGLTHNIYVRTLFRMLSLESKASAYVYGCILLSNSTLDTDGHTALLGYYTTNLRSHMPTLKKHVRSTNGYG